MSDERRPSGSFQLSARPSASSKCVRSFADRYRFTLREREVFTLLVEGHAQKEIAATLGVAESTVRFHAVGSYGKCGVKNQREMLALFARTLQGDAATQAQTRPNILTG